MSKGEPWRRPQTTAAVAGYVELERRVAAGAPLSAGAVAEALAASHCAPHGPAAVLHRLGQVAAVVQMDGGCILPAIRPKRAMTTQGEKDIRAALADARPFRPAAGVGVDLSPIADPRAIWERVRAILSGPARGALRYCPPGQWRPALDPARGDRPALDPKVAAYVLAEAGGRCEACGSAAAAGPAGQPPSVELVHLEPFARTRGADAVWNLTALCPACAKRLRRPGPTSRRMREELYQRSGRLSRWPERRPRTHEPGRPTKRRRWSEVDQQLVEGMDQQDSLSPDLNP